MGEAQDTGRRSARAREGIRLELDVAVACRLARRIATKARLGHWRAVLAACAEMEGRFSETGGPQIVAAATKALVQAGRALATLDEPGQVGDDLLR